MPRFAVLTLGCGLLACAVEEPGLCEGNAGEGVAVEASYRFEDAPLADADPLPVFVPPQAGIATELDVVMRGVGFDTLVSLQIRAVEVDGGRMLVDVQYSGGGLPLECVRDGELRVRAVPVPFADGLELDDLDGAEIELSTRIERSDQEVAETTSTVVLEAADY